MSIVLLGLNRLRQNLDAVKKAEKQATRKSLNDIAFHAKASTQGALKSWFPGAKSRFGNFLKRSILIDKASLENMVSVIGFSSSLKRQMNFESGQGIRTPEKASFILVPMPGVKRKPASILKSKNGFQNENGIFLKVAGVAKLMYVKKKTTTHRRKMSSFRDVVSKVYTRNFSKLYKKHFNEQISKIRG